MASVHVRAHQQAGHTNASDQINTAEMFLQVGGRPHTQSACLGAEPDREWIAAWVDGDLRLRAKDQPRRKIDVSGFAGKAPWLKPLPPELREFEERPNRIAAREQAERGEWRAT